MTEFRRSPVQLGTAAMLLAVLAMAAPTPHLSAAGPETQRVTLQAKKFEWTPERIEMRVGETLELSLESLDVKHGFKCKGLGIKPVKFKKGQPVTLTLTPQKPGTYRFACANFCGLGHGRMKGEIVVLP